MNSEMLRNDINERKKTMEIKAGDEVMYKGDRVTVHSQDKTLFPFYVHTGGVRVDLTRFGVNDFGYDNIKPVKETLKAGDKVKRPGKQGGVVYTMVNIHEAITEYNLLAVTPNGNSIQCTSTGKDIWGDHLVKHVEPEVLWVNATEKGSYFAFKSEGRARECAGNPEAYSYIAKKFVEVKE